MSAKVGFHPGARLEMREAADFYDLERSGLGTEFLDAVEQTMLQVLKYPESSPIALGAVRKRTVARFPYSVVYSARADGTCVSAFAHNSRRPFYWRDRI